MFERTPRSAKNIEAYASNRRQRHFVGTLYTLIGITIGITGLIAMFIVMPLSGDEEEVIAYFGMLPAIGQIWIALLADVLPEGSPIILFALPGVLVFFGGVSLVRAGRRRFLVPHHVGDPEWPEKYILYLRPFAADRSPSPFRLPIMMVYSPLAMVVDPWVRAWLSIPFGAMQRFEELLAHAFRHLATLITVGDPKEKLPQFGAWRFYCSPESGASEKAEDVWKAEVEGAIKGATLLIVHIATTESVKWELRKAIELCNPSQLILCVNVPGRRWGRLAFFGKFYVHEVTRAWDIFREECGAIFPRELPQAIGDTRFLTFDADWQFHIIPLLKKKVAWFWPGANPNLDRKTVATALAWLTWMMVREPAGRRTLRIMINMVTALASFLIGIVSLIFLLTGV